MHRASQRHGIFLPARNLGEQFARRGEVASAVTLFTNRIEEIDSLSVEADDAPPLLNARGNLPRSLGDALIAYALIDKAAEAYAGATDSFNALS